MINRRIQFIDSSPEELEERLSALLKKELESIKKDFQPKELEEYLTLEETAKRLDVDKSTIHNWRKKGIIKAYQIGNRVYTKRSEIDAAMQPLN